MCDKIKDYCCTILHINNVVSFARISSQKHIKREAVIYKYLRNQRNNEKFFIIFAILNHKDERYQ